MPGLFSNIKMAKVASDFVYAKPGTYLVKVEKVMEGQTRTKLAFVSIILTVLQILPSSETSPPHHVGEEINHYIEVSGNEYADRDMKGFLAATLTSFGVTVDQIDDKVADWALSPQQPLRGLILEMRNRTVATKPSPTKPAGGFFTKISYAREVPPEEVLKTVPQDVIAKFFPDNYLQKIIAARPAK